MPQSLASLLCSDRLKERGCDSGTAALRAGQSLPFHGRFLNDIHLCGCGIRDADLASQKWLELWWYEGDKEVRLKDGEQEVFT